MDENHLDPTEESLRDADAAGRIRARLLLLLGVVLVGWVFADGLLVYGRLPERLPTHFGAGGAPNGFGPKNVFNVFGPLLVASALLVAMALLRYRPNWYNFPGQMRTRLLPPEQRSHVYAPIQESLAWLAAGEAVAMALLSKQMWAAALLQRQGVSPVVLVAPLAVGLGAVVVGIVAARRRLKGFEASEGE